MTPDELAVMDNAKCILQVQGVRPFFSDKYDITQHPQYKYLSDVDTKNTFDVARFLKHCLRVKPDDDAMMNSKFMNMMRLLADFLFWWRIFVCRRQGPSLTAMQGLGIV